MLLVDIGHAPRGCADHALDDLHKAIAETPGVDPLRPHENEWIRDIVEDFASTGTDLLLNAQSALLGAFGIEDSGPILIKGGAFGAWSADEIKAAQRRLSRPIAEYEPDDWVLLVDLIIKTSINPQAVSDAVDTFTWGSYLAARLDAVSAIGAGIAPKVVLISLLNKIRTQPAPAIVRAQKQAWGFARSRIGLFIQGLIDDARRRLSLSIIRHVEHGLAKPALLEQALRDDFGTLNRDWRRIAITEAGETANLAYIGEFAPGTKLQRVEAYEGACPFCRKINGMIFTLVAADYPKKDGWEHIWPGKTNVGRSASPMRRTENGLEPRDIDEMWWPAAGVQHPNCRGRWIPAPRTEETRPGVDPKFSSWLRAELDKIQP